MTSFAVKPYVKAGGLTVLRALRLGAVRRTQSADCVALTFDDGPHPVYTPRLLEILRRHGAKATFFMLEARAARYPELVLQVAREGHDIGNHGAGHQSANLISAKDLFTSIRNGSKALPRDHVKLFRPPFGDWDLSTVLTTRLAGYTTVLWDVASEDHLAVSAEEISTRVLRTIRPGSIAIFHDRLEYASDARAFDRTESVKAVDQVLTALTSRVRFVGLGAILAQSKAELEYGFFPSDPQVKAAVIAKLIQNRDTATAPVTIQN